MNDSCFSIWRYLLNDIRRIFFIQALRKSALNFKDFKSEKEKLYSDAPQWFRMLRCINFLRCSSNLKSLAAWKHTLDYSKVPKINEHDLSEQFVRGSGPGGSAVNKNANCVVLTHLPTGTVVKCHISRSQDENRKLAREMLVAKLDEEINGVDSVIAQKKREEERKLKRNDYKKKKMALIKNEWKKREGLS